MPKPDKAVIVGSGPNGLTAAALLARAGWQVHVVEAGSTIGGGCRTEELTLPGFRHDVCAAVHPTAQLSPVFQSLNLPSYGVEWVNGGVALSHPLPEGDAAVLFDSLSATAAALGEDGDRWAHTLQPLLKKDFLESLLAPVWRLRAGALVPQMHFGLSALRSAAGFAQSRFRSEAARALFAGCAAHSNLPLDAAGTASFGLVLALSAHAHGWPIARGGSASIVAALAAIVREQGGTIETNRRVRKLAELPADAVIVFDLAPSQVAEICGPELPSGYRKKLERFPHGPGLCKVDWALAAPIPWRDPRCGRAGTVHVGGTAEEIAASEAAVARGEVPRSPFVIAGQPTAWDATRAPAGRHIAWGYCHVPNGSSVDCTALIEAQIERFAPGFRDLILARHTRTAAGLAEHNPTMIGGDFAGGANDLRHFLFRPVPRWNPYATPNPRLFICSSSTPPGGGVHGMCGAHAAETILRRVGSPQRAIKS